MSPVSRIAGRGSAGDRFSHQALRLLDAEALAGLHRAARWQQHAFGRVRLDPQSADGHLARLIQVAPCAIDRAGCVLPVRHVAEELLEALRRGAVDALVADRAQTQEPEARHARQPTFNEIIDKWLAAGCPNVTPTKASRHARVKSPNTLANARQLLGASIRPVIIEVPLSVTLVDPLDLPPSAVREAHPRHPTLLRLRSTAPFVAVPFLPPT